MVSFFCEDTLFYYKSDQPQFLYLFGSWYLILIDLLRVDLFTSGNSKKVIFLSLMGMLAYFIVEKFVLSIRIK